MKKLFISLAFICVAQFGFAQEAYKQDALKLIDASGGTSSQLLMIKSQVLPMISEDKHEAFLKDVEATLPALNSKIAEIYMSKLSHQEIKDILEFYNSPAGKKLSAVTPEITSESMENSQEWAMELQGIMMKYMQ